MYLDLFARTAWVRGAPSSANASAYCAPKW